MLLSLASAPCLAAAILVYWHDKFEREPFLLLLRSFFLGIIAVALTLLLHPIIIAFEPYLVIPGLTHLPWYEAFIMAGFTEEFLKMLMVLLFIYPNNHFNEPYDGITYAVVVSMGFASLENALYMIQHGHEVIYVRALTAVPAHATFGVMMGYYLGLAKFSKRPLPYFIPALLVPMLFHGAYDFSLFLASWPFSLSGALLSLAAGLYFSFKAIRLHQGNSPFRF